MSQLSKKLVISGEVTALTGLIIGGTSTALAIGMPDKLVVRNPVTNQPYIPGSSLKGKMRSLIELRDGTIGGKGGGGIEHGASNDPNAAACKLFGYTQGNDKNKAQQQPSRLIVRDSNLINAEALAKIGDMPYSEIKAENSIDRITSAANPRFFERVPAGAKFNLSLVLNIFTSDDEDELISDLIASLKMVEDDYLGGCGSRGCGQVKFTIIKAVERTIEYYRSGAEEKSLDEKFGVFLKKS